MAKSVAILGAGVVVGYSALPLAVPAVYIKIAQVEDVGPPKGQRDDVEISNHDSPALKKEFIPGWLGATDPTATWIYKKTDAVTLQGFEDDGVIRGWRIVLPDLMPMTFTAYLKDFGISTPRTDKMTSMVTLKIDDSVINLYPSS